MHLGRISKSAILMGTHRETYREDTDEHTERSAGLDRLAGCPPR
jgi:hypothetical protein